MALTHLCLFYGHAQTDYVAAHDTYVNSTSANTNYGSNTSVVTKISGNTRHAFYKFDLRDITGTEISSAILKLNVKSVSATTTRSIYTVSYDHWNEHTLTWNNQPAIGSAIASTSISGSDDENYVTWDITSYVNTNVLADGLITILVSDPNADGTGVDFYTKENGTKAPILTVTPAGSTPPPTGTAFIHPGGLFKQSDLDRMKYMVEAGIEPYATSFEELKVNSYASYNYVVQGDPSFTRLVRNGENSSAYHGDANAAYHNALMWAITGDTRHADKCVEIFNAWKNLTFVGGIPLDAGIFAWKMVEAAEIIKSTYSGWLATDVQAFQDMLVYPGYSDTGVPAAVNSTTVGSFYWRILNGDAGRHGNQDAIAFRAMLVMGVFLDNRKMYDRAYLYFTSQPGRTDDIPMPTGPSPSGSQISDNQYYTLYNYVGSQGTIDNYGYNGAIEHYIFENGQCQEASRDQQHAFLGLGMLAGVADVAWNQGNDVWSVLDNRMLKGFEYMSKYNTSYLESYPDQPSPWEPTVASGEFIQRLDRTGRWYSKAINPYFDSNFNDVSRGVFPGKRPVYEQAWAHFDVRMGLGDSAVWTKRGRDVAIAEAGYEGLGFSLDHPGWGALCFRRPIWAAGDPISGFSNDVPNFNIHNLPATVEAENYDFFTADGEGRTYHDLTPTNTGAEYRTDGVDIEVASEGSYALTSLESGEWLTYTCNVAQPGTYQIDVRYAASAGTGTIKFASNGADITTETSLPATGGMTTWAIHTISSSVNLGPGLNVIRIYIGGTSNAYKLNSFTTTLVQANLAPSVSITSPTTGSSATEGDSMVITATSSDSDGTVDKVEFFVGTYKLGEDTVAPYEATWNYLPAGTHNITAIATDNYGESNTSSVVNLTVNASGTTPQNSTLISSDDSYVHTGNSGTNYGSDISAVTKWSVLDHRYAFYKFNLSSINGAVSSATLRLKIKGIGGNSIRAVYLVEDDSWTESTITHSNEPLFGDELATISLSTSQGGTYVEWDVTDYVAIENGLDQTVTFCVRDTALTNVGIDFYTKESAGNEPQLQITYKPGSGGNASPSTSITAPSNGATFTDGDNITITASASDTDGTVSKVEFYQGTTKLGEDLTSPYSYTWNTVGAGNYDLTTVATDDLGATSTSSIVSITVNSSSGLSVGSIYQITARHSGKAMEIKDASNANGVEAVQNPYTGATNEQWELVDGGSGLFKLKAVHSNKYLEIKDAKSDDGMEAVQSSNSSSNNQKWDLSDLGNGYYKIVNQNSLKALGVLDGKTGNGEKVVQYNYSGSNSMQWDFQLVSSGSRNGVETQQEMTPTVRVYPNPVSEVLHIELPAIEESTFINVFNFAGQLLMNQKLEDTSTELQVQDLPAGIYLLEIRNHQEVIGRVKIRK
ncbi:putative secreted protein (Por secretion system target) [Marinoscillum furvescens DSM 4134]|uniref:Putative secreted protein (Por secretion system target) n=2 Tax=Marinoscillum furvescens TaxID=1026 RepID=A0A3D9L0L1_MARFU|nr:putative secreted protein (Por secretion system target) [Marinoscillum furvescens DSM 4134]